MSKAENIGDEVTNGLRSLIAKTVAIKNGLTEEQVLPFIVFNIEETPGKIHLKFSPPFDGPNPIRGIEGEVGFVLGNINNSGKTQGKQLPKVTADFPSITTDAWENLGTAINRAFPDTLRTATSSRPTL